MSDIQSSTLHDLNEAPVLKRPRDPTRHLMNKEQAASFQRGELDGTYQHTTTRPALEEAAPQGPPPSPAPQPPPPPPAPETPTVQSQPGEALVSNQPAEPPVQPGDSERVQKRINRLFGQMKSAQEANETHLARIADLESQVNQLRQPPAPPTAPQLDTDHYFGSGQQPQSQPAGQYVTRDDFRSFASELARSLQASQQANETRRASRAEAESEFAQDFQDPTFRQHYEAALGQFTNDPDGPYKAAVFTRGILADTRTAATPSGQGDAAYRQALGSGPSVPEGSSAPPEDRVRRYNAALAHARQTNQDKDYAIALAIRDGRL